MNTDPSDAPPGEDRVRIFLGGDVMTGRAIDRLFAEHLPDDFDRPGHVPASRYLAWSAALHGAEPAPLRHDYVWGAALGVLDRQQPDLRLVNLEVAVTRSDARADKHFVFRMHPANVGCLAAAGLDCCVLANNHVLDFGRPGLVETLRTLAAAGVGTVGAGLDDADAMRPLVRRLRTGGRLLVFAWGGRDAGIREHWSAGPGRPGVAWLPDWSARSVAVVAGQVAAHKRPGDLVVVSLHWGDNWPAEVPAAHRRFARALIETAGIDLVHGHSAHHPMPVEVHQGRLIVYGCGDLVNDYEGRPEYQPRRGELGALLFADLEARSGRLLRLHVHPVRRRRFRLETALPEEAAWLERRLRGAG